MQRGILRSIPTHASPALDSACCGTIHGMDAEAQDELTRLRARAYGPDADLADDPVAWARLHELEDLERRRRAEAAVSPPVRTGSSEPEDDPTRADTEGEDDEEATIPERPSRRPVVHRPRTLWLWAGSLAAVAAVASAASVAAATFVPVARTAGVAQVETLLPDPSVQTDSLSPLGIDPSEVEGYADFLGLTTFAGSTQIDSAGNRAECLFLIETADAPWTEDDGTFQGGFRYGGCGAGAFPATVEFVVTPELPEAFRQRFPVGSAVQFVRDGDRIGVFSDAD